MIIKPIMEHESMVDTKENEHEEMNALGVVIHKLKGAVKT